MFSVVVVWTAQSLKLRHCIGCPLSFFQPHGSHSPEPALYLILKMDVVHYIVVDWKIYCYVQVGGIDTTTIVPRYFTG